MQKRKPNKNLEKLYLKKGGCCYYCKLPTPFDNITKDHVYPKSQGFTLKDNWVFSCHSCNKKKGSMNPQAYVNFIIGKIVLILKKIEKNKFMVTQSEISKIKFYHSLMMNTKKLI